MANRLPSAMRNELLAALPVDALSEDGDDLSTYGRDWTRVHNPDPCAVVFPRTTEEVSRVLALCSKHHVGVFHRVAARAWLE